MNLKPDAALPRYKDSHTSQYTVYKMAKKEVSRVSVIDWILEAALQGNFTESVITPITERKVW